MFAERLKQIIGSPLVDTLSRLMGPATEEVRRISRERAVIYRREHPEANLASKTRYRSKPRAKAIARDRYERNKKQLSERSRIAMLAKYGLSLVEYNAMLERQGGCCASCARPASDFARRLAVDHCHVSGKVRGLLCFHCNTTLGKFGEDPVLLEQLAAYLRRTNQCQTVI